MKFARLISVLVTIIFFSGYVSAQNRDFDTFLDKYSKSRNVEVVTISSELLKMLSTSEDNELLKDLRWIKIINLNNPGDTPQVYENMKSDVCSLTAEGYEELMTVRNGQSEMYIYLKIQDRENLFFISDEKDCYTVINISGKITKALTQALLNNEISLN